MQKHYNYLTIDLDKKIYNKPKAVQGDSKSRYILVNLISNNTYYDLTNCTVKVYAVKKDKTEIFNDATIINAKQGQFEIELTNQMLAVAGDLKVQILILGSNQERLTSFSFFIEVVETIISDEAIESTNEYNALIGAFNKLEKWNGYFEETSGQIEEKYTERLNRIETLQKDNEIEVSTDKGYITCENTNNGQITDIKIEGRTLVNVIKNTSWALGTNNVSMSVDWSMLEPDTQYTFIVHNPPANVNLSNGYLGVYFTQVSNIDISKPALVTTVSDLSVSGQTKVHLYHKDGISFTSTELQNTKLMLIKGDHTQKPPKFFEGLKSIGDEKQFSITSISESVEIISKTNLSLNNTFGDNTWINSDSTAANTSSQVIFDIDIEDGFYYFDKREIGSVVDVQLINTDFTRLIGVNDNVRFLPRGKYGLRYKCISGKNTVKDISIRKVDKCVDKNVLFKNSSGNYEQVILRGLEDKDIIEEHLDNKYYYRKKCNEVVLNGTEPWSTASGGETSDYITFYFNANLLYKPVLSDKFKSLMNFTGEEGVYPHINKYLYITISKSKLSPQNIEGFKTWLKTNPVTVVYQLATEEVYECINLDLNAYEGEISVICNSNIPISSMSFKIANHISNIVNIINDRVNAVENQVIDILKSQAKALDMFKSVLAGDMQTLAYELYPEDFEEEVKDEVKDETDVTDSPSTLEEPPLEDYII